MAENSERDAVKAASKTHKVLFENDNVRVLEVHIQPTSHLKTLSPLMLLWPQNTITNQLNLSMAPHYD